MNLKQNQTEKKLYHTKMFGPYVEVCLDKNLDPEAFASEGDSLSTITSPKEITKYQLSLAVAAG